MWTQSFEEIGHSVIGIWAATVVAHTGRKVLPPGRNFSQTSAWSQSATLQEPTQQYNTAVMSDPDTWYRLSPVQLMWMQTVLKENSQIDYWWQLYHRLTADHHATTHSTWASDAPPTVWTLQGSSAVCPQSAARLPSPSWAWHTARSGHWLWSSASSEILDLVKAVIITKHWRERQLNERQGSRGSFA